MISARHQQVKLNDLEQIVVPVLNGSHDRKSLIDHLRKAGSGDAGLISVNGEILKTMEPEKLSKIVEKVLTNLRDSALLVD